MILQPQNKATHGNTILGINILYPTIVNRMLLALKRASEKHAADCCCQRYGNEAEVGAGCTNIRTYITVCRDKRECHERRGCDCYINTTLRLMIARRMMLTQTMMLFHADEDDDAGCQSALGDAAGVGAEADSDIQKQKDHGNISNGIMKTTTVIYFSHKQKHHRHQHHAPPHHQPVGACIRYTGIWRPKHRNRRKTGNLDMKETRKPGNQETRKPGNQETSLCAL